MSNYFSNFQTMDQRFVKLWCEKTQLLSNNLSKVAEQSNTEFDEITSETKIENSNETCERGFLSNLFSNIEVHAQAVVDEAQKELEIHHKTVNEKKIEIERLKDVLQSAKAEYENESKEVEKYKNNVESINQKIEELKDLKYPILTYKLLTGANFVYKDASTSTKGYIQGVNSRKIPFNFSNSQLGDREQTEQLWSLVETASHKPA